MLDEPHRYKTNDRIMECIDSIDLPLDLATNGLPIDCESWLSSFREFMEEFMHPTTIRDTPHSTPRLYLSIRFTWKQYKLIAELGDVMGMPVY